MAEPTTDPTDLTPEEKLLRLLLAPPEGVTIEQAAYFAKVTVAVLDVNMPNVVAKFGGKIHEWFDGAMAKVEATTERIAEATAERLEERLADPADDWKRGRPDTDDTDDLED